MVTPMADQELARAARLKLSWPDLDPAKASLARLVESVKEKGYAAVDGRFIPGLNAISAPVLNWQGEAEAALTITSPDPGVLDEAGQAMALLRAACRDLSVVSPEGGP
jgi:DNA-binding IclR family transcriptional regulator